MFGDPRGEIGKAPECISISGDQFSLTCFDVRESTKPIDFQFKDELIGIESLSAAGKPYGTHLAWQHG